MAYTDFSPQRATTQESQREVRMALRPRGSDLEREYKPLFDAHGPEGIPITQLKAELTARDNLSSQQVSSILTKYDRNRDNYLTYDEFFRMMTSDDGMTGQDRSRMKRFLGFALQNIVPNTDRQDFLQAYSCCPPPVFMLTITLIEVIIFAVYAALLADSGNPVTATTGVDMNSPLLFTPRRRYEVWRYITYMFLHQGYLHLIGNMVVQLLLGLPLELAHKWWRVILIYVLGVFAGSLAHSMTDPHSSLVGASGGCYALFGGHIASTIINWKEMNYKLCSGSVKRLLLSAPMRLTVLLVYVCIDTGFAVYRRFFSADKHKIGISAHIAGLMAGLVLGVLLLRNIRKLSWELTLGWIGLAVYLAYFVAAVLFNSLYPDYPSTDWSKCCS